MWASACFPLDRPQAALQPIGLPDEWLRQHNKYSFLVGCGGGPSRSANEIPLALAGAGVVMKSNSPQHHRQSSKPAENRPASSSWNIWRQAPWLLIFWNLRPGRMRSASLSTFPRQEEELVAGYQDRIYSGMSSRPF